MWWLALAVALLLLLWLGYEYLPVFNREMVVRLLEEEGNDLEELITNGSIRKILIIAARQSDETLGCGGLIAWAKERGLGVTVVALTWSIWHESKKQKEADFFLAGEILGLDKSEIKSLGYRPGSLLKADQLLLTEQLTAVIAEFAPEMIFCNWRRDGQTDFSIAAREAESLAREFGLPLYEFPLFGDSYRRPRYAFPERWFFMVLESSTFRKKDAALRQFPKFFRRIGLWPTINKIRHATEIFFRYRP